LERKSEFKLNRSISEISFVLIPSLKKTPLFSVQRCTLEILLINLPMDLSVNAKTCGLKTKRSILKHSTSKKLRISFLNSKLL